MYFIFNLFNLFIFWRPHAHDPFIIKHNNVMDGLVNTKMFYTHEER